MSLYGALQDVPLARGGSRRGLGLWTTQQVMGGASQVVTHPFRSVVSAQVTLNKGTVLSAGTAFVTVTVVGNVVTIFTWTQAGAASAGGDTIHIDIKGKY